jgi:hypothetical protein
VWVESEVGVGSTLFVWLPCGEAVRAPEGADRASVRLESTRARGPAPGEG